ncbi:MAG: FadR family transcriptional regulator [Gammaproteobacteria bacterium]|nr:FadR family transcriptional regulator [Gammaproteobacteria bacterium]
MALIDRNSNLSQRVTQELGKLIVCGDYTVDKGLPTEADLCEQFGVSRSAVREAVKMLSAKGLISSRPRQGIRILPEEKWNIFDPDLLKWLLERSPSLKVVQEFLQLRITIEPEAASLAARYADEKEIGAIAESLERMKASSASTEEMLEADIAFHVSILYASKNRFYIRLRNFVKTALNVSIRYTSTIKADREGVVADHTKVYKAIKNRNPERAKNAMLVIIDEALTFIEDAMAHPERYQDTV